MRPWFVAPLQLKRVIGLELISQLVMQRLRVDEHISVVPTFVKHIVRDLRTPS